ncbi:MAG TPA: MopE-related protein [Kofleriaceae bacterium]|nr:MopE-related protein [Kofleriaceae bacterium]
MGKLFAWPAAAVLAICSIASMPVAHAGDPLKPYVVLALDTSGSMGTATGSGPPSCGGADTRLNHAVCAINNIVNSYGDMVFALGRFRMATSGTYPTCTAMGAGTAGSATCNGTADMFELLTPLVDGNNDLAALWTDGTYNTCTGTGTDPEIYAATGNTPLAGTLVGAKQYFSGLQAPNFPIWPSGQPGFAPIVNDPTAGAFLPGGCNPSPTCTTNCCAAQCRPYIVVLLTDGAETCVAFDPNTTAAATSLLTTDVTVGGMPRRYRVLTRPIGFGIAPPVPPMQNEIEDIAQAGGAIDIAGQNEGFYASDEAGLQLAISAILDDAIKTEACNNLDDDCDAAIDEDFPGKGSACDNGKLGVCRRTGSLVCRADGTGLSCNAPAGPSGTAEVCNNQDDDCDGKTDEGLTGCSCTPQGELCNNNDDDCDGLIDEGIQRPCGTGTCQGVETCMSGVFTGCTAPQAGTEVCNGLDDNCDGLRDGFNERCSNMPPVMPFPAGDSRNNPGDPARSPIPQNICHPGLRTCPANVGPPNAFGPCLQEQQPLTEVCNGLDDDCDNMIDEGTGGADCSSNCGVGTTVCVNGMIQCNSVTQPDDDTCDGVDDDCDMMIDEDYVSSGACGMGQVCNGMEQCLNGMVTCVGTPVGQESCNCTDDDCDAQVDEGSLCPGGTQCVQCQCAPPCIPGEFPCALGKKCVNNFCVADPCFGVTCPDVNGNKQVCKANGNTPTCISACDPSVITCAPPLICYGPTGECRPDDCTTFPDRCSASERCISGACVSNPCAGVNCPGDQYCVSGQCVGSCADVECDAGKRCELGMCVADPCGAPCPFGKTCNDDSGQCVRDPCEFVQCTQGQECDPHHGGKCVDSLCLGTACPEPGQVCKLGTCYDPQVFTPDAGTGELVTTGGGGGGCSAGGGSSGGALAGLGLVLGLLLARRRRS